MKSLSSKASLLLLSLCISTTAATVEAGAAQVEPVNPPVALVVTESDHRGGEVVVPYADITGWRYKSENGKVYRRLYNYSKQKWIGEWELC